jgi:hypothetical protein
MFVIVSVVRELSEIRFVLILRIFRFPKYELSEDNAFVLILCELKYSKLVIPPPPPPNAAPVENVSNRNSFAFKIICGVGVSVSFIVTIFNDFTVCVELYRVR